MFDNIPLIYWLIGSGILLGLLGLLIWYLRRPLPEFEKPVAMPLPLEPIHLVFKDEVPFAKGLFALKDQSSTWRRQMQIAGRVLSLKGVKHIVLLHGTFVGSDPASIIPSLRGLFPRLDSSRSEAIGGKMKGLLDRLTGDNGNFLPSYVALLEAALGHDIACGLFYWSSANHHYARLEGAVRLIEQQLKQGPHDGRTLLIGHSHARQVFAIFTHLLVPSEKGEQLWKLIHEYKLADANLREKSRWLTRQSYDFVTLGGPVRYPWTYLKGMRVLHIVNHRGEDAKLTSPWAFWNTSSGDYVQQWGMMGSDSLALTTRERLLNVQLDGILGVGWHTRVWYRTMSQRQRLGDFGRTLLIDYLDASQRLPNFIKTGFGHGVYTRFEVMLYHAQLICRYLYDTDISDNN